MAWIFEVEDKFGRIIHLSRERWLHINAEHPEVAPFLEELKETIRQPTKITEYPYDEAIRYFYKYFKTSRNYLLVIVNYLNGEGFVITAYFKRSIT